MQKFSELPYTRPDLEQFRKDYEAQIKAFVNAADYEAARTAYLKIQDLMMDLQTKATLVSIRNTCNMADEFYDAEQNFFDQNMPQLMPLDTKFSEALTATRFRKEFEAEYGPQMFVEADISLKTQSPAIIEEAVRENELCSEYSKVIAKCQTEFRGESCNFYGLLKHMQSDDRQERREAAAAEGRLYASVSDDLNRIYSELTEVRQRKAKKLGYDNFLPLGYLQMGRTDWNKEDVAELRKQVKAYVVPCCQELYAAQAKRIGVDKIKYYDEKYRFKEGNPMPRGTKDELVAKAAEMYRELSPETGEYFDFMTRYDLFDLETKPNKHMGGYMTILANEKAPFIFSNFNGTSADVEVLTHEAGHAFQGYVGSREQKLASYWMSTSEVCEIHSMSMELFTYPWMDKFFGTDADRYRYAHLSDTILVLPYLVMVDEFQERVYLAGTPIAEERYAIWKDLEKDYMPWRDYDGQDELEEKGGFWMQKQHIFLYPLYYVDYALAQICAWQFFNKNRADHEQAWQDYLRLCRDGGSLPYRTLLKRANLACPFDEGVVEKTLAPIMELLRRSPYHTAE